MMIEGRCALNKCRVRCKRERYCGRDALKKMSVWRRWKSAGYMVSDTNRTMNGRALVGIRCILSDGANIGAVGAKDVTGSKNVGA